MQMINVLQRLAELDAQNPNRPEHVEKLSTVNENVNIEECGMMDTMSRPSTPASINMTAATGEELSAMLKDIMTLAGNAGANSNPADALARDASGLAVVDMEPDMDQDVDGNSQMRSMIDKLNPGPDDEQKVDEWDNQPAEATDVPPMEQDAMLNTGGHNQDPAGHPGAAEGRHLKNHPVASPEATYESLMAEYKKFISEDHTADRNEIMNDLVRDTAAQLGIDLQSPVSYDVAKEIAQRIEAASSDTPYWNQKQHTEDDVLSWMDDAGLIGQDQDDTGYDLDDPKHPDYAEHQSDQADYNRDKRRHGDFDETNTMESMLKLAGFKK
jgi:hypothetical protein